MNYIDLILKALPSAIATIDTLREWVSSSVQTLQQAKELTPEQEAARDAFIASEQGKSYWGQD